MSLIGAMIGKDGILVFSDTRIIQYPERGIFIDLEEGKIHKILSAENCLILSAGDYDIFESLKELIKIKDFTQSEVDSITSSLNKKYWELSGEISSELLNSYIWGNNVHIILAGFEKDRSPILTSFNSTNTHCISSNETRQGFAIFSPLSWDIDIELQKQYKPDKSFEQLEIIAKNIYDYCIEHTAFVGGELKTERLLKP